MKELNLTNVEPEKGFGGPEPGGYVLKIINVEDVPGKEYLKIDYDFAEGEYANHYLSLFDRFGFWGGTMYKSYKDKSLGWFKAFISDVEASNPGYKWDNDEKKLEGRLFGAVLGAEEYRSNDGEVKESLKVKRPPQRAALIPEFPAGTFSASRNWRCVALYNLEYQGGNSALITPSVPALSNP